jgi:hypothetical protein
VRAYAVVFVRVRACMSAGVFKCAYVCMHVTVNCITSDCTLVVQICFV